MSGSPLESESYIQVLRATRTSGVVVVAILPVCRRRVRVSVVVVVVVSFLLPLSLPALRYSNKGGESNSSTADDDEVIVDDIVL